MNKKFGLQMLDVIENLQLENLALRAILEKIAERRSGGTEEFEKMLTNLMANPQAQKEVGQRCAPIRLRIERDADLEEALQQFLRIAPPPKDVN